MAGLELEWQWAGTKAPSAVVKPLVVLLPWVWSEPQYVNKYTHLCHQNGWDVLVARWPMLALWFPLWSRALAATLIRAVGTKLQENGYRPVVFWSFSGAAKGVYSSLLSQLAAPQQLKQQDAVCAAAVLRCAVGQMFDSGPVDFSSDMGRRLLSPKNRPNAISSSSSGSGSNCAEDSSTAAAVASAARAAGGLAVSAGIDVAAGTLDFFLMEWFDRDRDNMWSALRNTPVGGPVLMLYSRKDELADAAQIASLAAALKRRGRHVVEQAWHDSPHVGHLRAHPQAYSEAVSYLLSAAVQEWAERSSRRWEGRDWTARWQQQQQQSAEAHQQATNGIASGARSSSAVIDGLATVTCNYAAPRQLVLHHQGAVAVRSHSGHSSSHAESQQQQQQQQQQWGRAGADYHQQQKEGNELLGQDQQQQQQLVMQPTKGVFSGGRPSRGPARGHQHPGSNGSSRQTATLVRAGTSGSSSESPAASKAAETAAALDYAARRAEVLAQQLTPWLLASQMAFDGGSNGGGCGSSGGSNGSRRRLLASEAGHGWVPSVDPVSFGSNSSSRVGTSPRGQPAASAAAVVRISSWPATATAVAAAMNAGQGNEPVCSDSTLLSHSLRCLASSFLATHNMAPATAGSSGCSSSEVDTAMLLQQQRPQQQQQQQQARQEQGRQQQQQPYLLRMVNRLRSKL